MSRRGSILQDYGGHFQPMPTDAQEASANYYQRSKEFNAQLQQRQKEKSDADKYRNLSMIDDATDPSKYQSSTQKANSLATEQLLGLRNEFASKSNIPADQLYMELQQKLTPIAQGYNAYKNDLNDQEAMAKEAVKINPNLNLEKVLFDLQQQADKHHLITNPDGSVNFNQATIGTSSNALSEILKPENAWKYSKGIKPVLDYVKTQGKDTELFSQSPDGSQINYKAKIPDWATLVDQRGNPISVDPKTGLIPRGAQPILALKGTKQDYQEVDENGRTVTKTMTVVPQETMNKILSNDELEYAFEGDWQKHKQLSKIDVDPSNERDLKKIYFSQWLADNGLAQPYVSARTHLPPQPRISVKVGGESKKNDTQDFVQRYKSAVDNKDVEGIKEVARGLFSGNGSYEFAGFKIDRDDLGAVLSYKLKGDDEVKQETLRLDDPNIYYKLGGLYQKITGSDSKLEKNIFEGKKDYSNKGKTFNVVDPNTGKVVMSGVDQSAADKAKAKGYKIQ